MPRWHGVYEYDDDDLTPGKKKEGGLHQNLFDKDGKLAGSARFIPSDREEQIVDPEPVFVYVTGEAESRERTKAEIEREEFVQLVVREILNVAIAKGAPLAKRLWLEKALPAIRARRAQLARRRAIRQRRRKKSGRPPRVAHERLVEPSAELAAAPREFRANLTSSEAQTKYLIALAARQFSEEQMRQLANANITDDPGFQELERAIAELPTPQVIKVLEQLEAEPSLLNTDVLDGLGLILGVAPRELEYLPVEDELDE